VIGAQARLDLGWPKATLVLSELSRVRTRIHWVGRIADQTILDVVEPGDELLPRREFELVLPANAVAAAIEVIDVDAIEVVVRVILTLTAAERAAPYAEARQRHRPAEHLLCYARAVDDVAVELVIAINAQRLGRQREAVVEAIAAAHRTGGVPKAVVTRRGIDKAAGEDWCADTTARRKAIGVQTGNADAVPSVLVGAGQPALSLPRRV